MPNFHVRIGLGSAIELGLDKRQVWANMLLTHGCPRCLRIAFELQPYCLTDLLVICCEQAQFYWGNDFVDEDLEKIEGRLRGEQVEPEQPENMLKRVIYMLLIAVMISLAQTVLGVATVVQFVVMLVNNKRPNERLADFGTDLGIWVAKAARFQTAASNVKPWPWTELD